MSNLARFGIDPGGDPAKQIPKICAVLEAILNNPDHLVGNSRSLIKFPAVKAPAGAVEGRKIYNSTIVPEYFKKDGGTWSVVFTKAKLWVHSLQAESYEVKIEAGAGFLDDEDPRIEFELATGDNGVWLVWTVDENNAVLSDPDPDPVLTVGAEPVAEPHTPKRPNDGATGDYKQKIGNIFIESDKAPVWNPECTTTAVHLITPTISHVGGAAELYSGYDNGDDQWRTLEAAGQLAVQVAGDTVEYRGNSLNAKFQFVEEGASAPETGEEINFEDGLNTDGELDGDMPPAAPTPQDIILPIVTAGTGITVTRTGANSREFVVASDGGGPGYGAGWWGTVQWVDLSSSSSIELIFEDGRLITAQADAVAVPGTEASPGGISRTF